MAISFQSGIGNRPPELSLLVPLQSAGGATDTAQARAAIESLRDLVRKERRSELIITSRHSVECKGTR